MPRRAQYDDELTAEQRDWLFARAELTRKRWRASEAAMKKSSAAIRNELAKLRAIDSRLPFMILTVLLEPEMALLDREDYDVAAIRETR